MKTENMHFGLCFPRDFILDEDDRHKWAKLLLMSRNLSLEDAKNLTVTTKHFLAADQILDDLHLETEALKMPSENENDNVENELNSEVLRFYAKFQEWIRKGTFLTEEEIIELTNEFKAISPEMLHSIIDREQVLKLSTPAEFREHLSKYIIGQEKAVEIISTLVHEQKLRSGTKRLLPKSTGLFLGSTGTGKTYLINKARELLDVPIVRVSCGDLVPSGYRGTTINMALTLLHHFANRDLGATSKGIIHFDEIDKLATSYHKGEDAWRSTVQQEILKLFDMNETLSFPSPDGPHAPFLSIMTNNLMLVFSGAFHGIEDIILQRLKKEYQDNLNLVDLDNIIDYCTPLDVQAYGMLPELAARISFISPLKNHSPMDLVNMMKNSKESELIKHKNKCDILGIQLTITDEAINVIADEVYHHSLGARYIGTTLNLLLSDIYLNYHDYKGKEYILSGMMAKQKLSINKYQLVFKAFESNTTIEEIENRFNLSKDEILDLFLQWKSLNKEKYQEENKTLKNS